MAQTSRLQIPYPAGTDTDDVPTWMINMATRLDAIIPPTSHGTIANRPVSSVGTPGIADRLYYATDVDPETLTDRQSVTGQFYRDNGTGWDPIGPFASKVNAGFFTPPVATGTLDVTGLGFQPKLVEFSYGPNDDVDTNMAFGRGFAKSPSNRYATFFRASSSSGGIYQRRTRTNRCIYMIDNNGTVTMDADLSTFLADGYRLNFATVPAAGNTIQWRAWG